MAGLRTLSCSGCESTIDTFNPRAIGYTCKLHRSKKVRGGVPCNLCGLWLDSQERVKEVICSSCAHVSIIEAEIVEQQYVSVPPKFLKAVRKSSELTQKDLSFQINVNTASISRAERGKELPRREHVDWAYENAIDLGVSKEDYIDD